MTPYDPYLFAEKYQMALQSDVANKPQGGLCGFELEWNLLDTDFQPLLTVGSGPNQQSFVDYLRSECITPRLKPFSQLEVFHWMIEWATRPYYGLQAAVYEGRLMEAVLINALDKAGREFGKRLYIWHGNLPVLTGIDHDSIPTSWHVAKRRYLERCVDLYGDSLATAGMHTNLSLPDTLLELDFIHLPATKRIGGSGSPIHFDEYKSQFYITASRLMRAFAALFIATCASTPFKAGLEDDNPGVLLTSIDSVRSLTFPNPPELDQPELYRSYEDYLRISYDLVKRGVRFGNNNWTPVRARSFAEPVERLIELTSEQLSELYAHGLYSVGQEYPMEEMARQVEIQNLLARINLPMARVEVRTDDGGHPLSLEIANLCLKHLLMLRIYADATFARAFRYDQEDILRARRNEEQAARHGLIAEIEHPLTGKPIEMRTFLRWTLQELRPLAEALGMWELLTPLVEMSAGAPNTAELLRSRVLEDLGPKQIGEDVLAVAPLDYLAELAREREHQVLRDVEAIAGSYPVLMAEGNKLSEFLQYGREAVHLDPPAPLRFRPMPDTLVKINYADKTSEILALAEQLIRIPSVTASPQERLDEVQRAGIFIYDYLRDSGLESHYFNKSKYPAVLAGFPGNSKAPVMLNGHFDVVEPDPDESQFEPRVEGDYLFGRGAGDMKTVVATYLVWMKDVLQQGSPFPPVQLLLVGNEENGEGEPMGTPHVLEWLAEQEQVPEILIAGERTGEKGDETWGEICIENRGVARFEIIAHGQRGHSGIANTPVDLTERLIAARSELQGLLNKHLTVTSTDGWQSQMRFPFVQVGIPGVYNITPEFGRLGIEIRTIPADSLDDIQGVLGEYCQAHGLELATSVKENGVACDLNNPYLQALIMSVRKASGGEPRLGRKLAGTSARFAPHSQGVVWGQTGIGVHARDERHYIPSILPYYQALQQFGQVLIRRAVDKTEGA